MKAFFDNRSVTAAILASIIVLVLTISLQTSTRSSFRYRVGLDKAADTEKSAVAKSHSPKPKAVSGYDSNGKEKLAYVTFLSGTVVAGHDDDLEKDNYFIATRILVWQLLHNPRTRTKSHDVIVMVTPSVSKHRIERLKQDGAIIHAVEFLHAENDQWIHAEKPRWADVMTKLRAWEMVQYSRMLMLDGDTLLRESLDGVFDDPGAQIQQTLPLDNLTRPVGESPFPKTYLLGSLSEVAHSNHEFPPTHGTGLKTFAYMNAGFFLLAPSQEMFEYYNRLLSIEGSFDPKYPEQNLLNAAHNWDGPMPWKELSYSWNIRCPNENDFEKGLISMHEKWWTQPFIFGNQKVKDWLVARRWEMQGWYDGWDTRNEER